MIKRTERKPKDPIFTRGFAFAFFSTVCGSFIMYMLITTVSGYAETFGASKTVAGLVSSIFLIGELITRLVFSKFVCRIGWKKMIAFSMSFQFACCCLYFTISSIAMLIVVRLLHGLSFGLTASVNATTSQYLIPKSRHGEGNGVIMTATALSVCLGPLSGGALYDHFGPFGCFTAASLLAIFVAIGVVCAKAPYPETDVMRAAAMTQTSGTGKYKQSFLGASEKTEKYPRTSILDMFIERSSLPASVCIFFCAVAYSCILSFIRMFGKEAGLSSAVSAFFVVYAIVLVASRPSVGRVQDHIGDDPVVYPCVTMQIISFVLLWLVPNPVTVVIAAVLMAFGYGTLNSVFMTVAFRNTLYERKSFAISTYWIAIDSGVGFGPVFLGAIAEKNGYGIMFLSAAIISAVVLPIYYFLCHNRKTIAS